MGWSGWRQLAWWPRWPLRTLTLWWLAALVFVALSFAIVLLLVGGCLGHGALADRHHGALLLAMHADLRGAGHCSSALFMRFRS